jgi:subtilisin family serine protease
MKRSWIVLAPLSLSLVAIACQDSNVGQGPGQAGQVQGSALTLADKQTVWVLLKQQANLATARVQGDWNVRGQQVYEQLTTTATTSQAPLQVFLKSRGALFRPFWITNALQVTADKATLDEVARRPDVAKIVPDRVYLLPPVRAGVTQNRILSTEWGIDNIRAPEAWAAFHTRGEGIVVANIDTGVQFDHPALVQQYRGTGSAGFDHNYNWFDPANICGQPSLAPCDNNGHGTHTMGTMVGDDGNPGANQIGVAPKARWIAAKGCEVPDCSTASLLAAGQWVLAPTDLAGLNPRPDLRPQIVNNSWGGGPGDLLYQATVQAWLDSGIFPAFANGNIGPGCGSASSPGDFPETYAVGAYDINNVIAVFSSRGPSVLGGSKPNIAAPGVDVRSSVPGNGYASKQGTSMATPHLAGTVALIWSAAPSLVGDIPATRALLDATARDTGDLSCGGTPENNNVFGEGRLDAFAAVEQAPRGPTGTLTGTVTAADGTAISGATVKAHGPGDLTAVTDASGAYSMRPPVGTYDVAASAFGFLSRSVAGVVIADGATTTADFTLAAAPTHTVLGEVRDGTNQPLSGVKVIIAGIPLAPALTDASGHFSIEGVPEGTYDITASAGSCFDQVTQSVTVDGDEAVSFLLPQRKDAFGYFCRPAPFAFIEANTVLPLVGDVNTVAVPLPFPFTFYGQTYTTAFAGTDGFLSFVQPPRPPFDNAASLPNPNQPNAAIYPFWDDLMVDSASSVRTELVGTAPNRQFVVEWRDVAFFANFSRIRFEVVLSENGDIVTQYHTAGPTPLQRGSSAAIGLENETGTVALQYSNNTPSVDSGTAVQFSLPPSGFVEGTITDANDHLPIAGARVEAVQDGAVVRTAITNAAGQYRTQLLLGNYTLTASAGNYTGGSVPISVSVGPPVHVDFTLRTARAALTPSTVQLVMTPNQTRNRTLTLENTGLLDLTFDIAESGGTKQVTAATARLERNAAADPNTFNTRDLFALGIQAAGWRTEATGDVLASFTPTGTQMPFGVGLASNLWISDQIVGSKLDTEFTIAGAATGRKFSMSWASSPGDMAYDPARDVVCQVNVGADNGIYCWDPATGNTAGSITGPFPWTVMSQRGLAYRPDDDSFYIGGWNSFTIYHVKGLSHSDKGAVIGSCVPPDGRISGLAWNGTSKVLWETTNSPTDTIYELNPDDCTVLSTLAHPRAGGFQGGGLEMDESGNLWMIAQRSQEVLLVESGVRAFNDVPWLSVSPTSGTLAPGGKTSLTVSVDTTGLAQGAYLANIFILTNSGREDAVRVPVSLVVSGYQQGVRAGGNSYQDTLGDTWAADKQFSAGSWGYIQRRSTASTSHPITGTADPALFQTQRIDPYAYSFDNLTSGTYQVELNFAELARASIGRRLFDVIIENALVLPAHDIVFEAGQFAADKQTFFIEVPDTRLDVRFIPRAGFDRPVINSLRVTQRPDR